MADMGLRMKKPRAVKGGDRRQQGDRLPHHAAE
jgi:hypothetical protein